MIVWAVLETSENGLVSIFSSRSKAEAYIKGDILGDGWMKIREVEVDEECSESEDEDE